MLKNNDRIRRSAVLAAFFICVYVFCPSIYKAFAHTETVSLPETIHIDATVKVMDFADVTQDGKVSGAEPVEIQATAEGIIVFY